MSVDWGGRAANSEARKKGRAVRVAALAVPLAIVGMLSSAHGDLIRVQMMPNAPFAGRAPIEFTGVESSVAAADSVFGGNGSNSWNYLKIAPEGTQTSDPSFSNLVDSAGVTTSVGISFTGTISSANDTPITTGANALENDHFVTGGTSVVSYTISGLAANTLMAFYLYSPNFTHYDSGDSTDEPNRGYQLTANGETISVPSGYGTNNMLAFVTTNALGEITGTWSTPLGNEGDWSGFQIATVPEPSSLVLLGSGILGLVVACRRRRNPI